MIERIENPLLWVRFCLKKLELEQQHGSEGRLACATAAAAGMLHSTQ